MAAPIKRSGAQDAHKVAYQELIALVTRHKDALDAVDMLAVAANIVGKIIAMQDQRVMTRAACMEVVARNIEEGNAEVVAALTGTALPGTH
jgi:hypothetical protein